MKRWWLFLTVIFLLSLFGLWTAAHENQPGKPLVTYKVRTGTLPWGLEYKEFQHDDGCWYMLVCSRARSGMLTFNPPESYIGIIHKASCPNPIHK